jgi:3,5-epimerase/4-reductase
MKTAILGTGYVAAAFARVLHFLGHHPMMLSRHWLNYMDSSALEFCLRGYGAQLLINASGFNGNSVDDTRNHKDAAYHSLVTLSAYSARVAASLDIPFIHISSGCIYNGDYPFAETDKPNFTPDLYQNYKLLAEEDVLASKARAYIYRIRMPFSWHNHPRNWLTKLIGHDKILDGLNSITFLDEFAMRGFWLAKDAKPPGIYHAAYQTPVRTLDVVQMLHDAKLRTKPIELYDPKLFVKEHVRRSECVLDGSKFEKTCGATFGDPMAALRWCISHYGGVGPVGRPPASAM